MDKRYIIMIVMITLVVNVNADVKLPQALKDTFDPADVAAVRDNSITLKDGSSVAWDNEGTVIAFNRDGQRNDHLENRVSSALQNNGGGSTAQASDNGIKASEYGPSLAEISMWAADKFPDWKIEFDQTVPDGYAADVMQYGTDITLTSPDGKKKYKLDAKDEKWTYYEDGKAIDDFSTAFTMTLHHDLIDYFTNSGAGNVAMQFGTSFSFLGRELGWKSNSWREFWPDWFSYLYGVESITSEICHEGSETAPTSTVVTDTGDIGAHIEGYKNLIQKSVICNGNESICWPYFDGDVSCHPQGYCTLDGETPAIYQKNVYRISLLVRGSHETCDMDNLHVWLKVDDKYLNFTNRTYPWDWFAQEEERDPFKVRCTGSSLSFGSSNQIVLITDEDFEKACIKFEHEDLTSGFSNLVDDVSGSPELMCNSFIVSESDLDRDLPGFFPSNLEQWGGLTSFGVLDSESHIYSQPSQAPPNTAQNPAYNVPVGSQSAVTSALREKAEELSEDSPFGSIENINEYVKNLDGCSVDHGDRTRTTDSILRDDCVSGPSDRAAMFVSLANALDVNAVYVEAVRSDWGLDCDNIDPPLHAFVNIGIGETWKTYDPAASGSMSHGSYKHNTDRYDVVAAGLDSWSLGFTDNQKVIDYFEEENC